MADLPTSTCVQPVAALVVGYTPASAGIRKILRAGSKAPSVQPTAADGSHHTRLQPMAERSMTSGVSSTQVSIQSTAVEGRMERGTVRCSHATPFCTPGGYAHNMTKLPSSKLCSQLPQCITWLLELCFDVEGPCSGSSPVWRGQHLRYQMKFTQSHFSASRITGEPNEGTCLHHPGHRFSFRHYYVVHYEKVQVTWKPCRTKLLLPRKTYSGYRNLRHVTRNK